MGEEADDFLCNTETISQSLVIVYDSFELLLLVPPCPFGCLVFLELPLLQLVKLAKGLNKLSGVVLLLFELFVSIICVFLAGHRRVSPFLDVLVFRP